MTTAIKNVKQDLFKKELATKSDLIALRYDMLKFVVWTGLGCSITLASVLGGMIGHGFNWF